jgi:hypothetical protein
MRRFLLPFVLGAGLVATRYSLARADSEDGSSDDSSSDDSDSDDSSSDDSSSDDSSSDDSSSDDSSSDDSSGDDDSSQNGDSSLREKYWYGHADRACPIYLFDPDVAGSEEKAMEECGSDGIDSVCGQGFAPDAPSCGN